MVAPKLHLKPKKALLLLFAAMLPCFVLAQLAPGWQWQNPEPQGNGLNDVEVLSQDTVIMIGALGSILRTTDKGKNWSIRNSGTDNDLNGIDFVDTDTGFAVGNSGTILQTTDGGLSWQKLSASTSENLNEVFFTNSDTGWAVGGSFNQSIIQYTTNGGNSWSTQFKGNVVSTKHELQDIHFISKDTGWAFGNSSIVLKTTDGGVNWTEQGPSFIEDIFEGYFLGPDTGWFVGESGLIVSTTDGGNNWDRSYGVTSWDLNDLYFKNSDTGWAIGESETILQTSDGGNSWQSKSSGNNQRLTAFDFRGWDTSWLIGEFGHIQYTKNNGSSWQELSKGVTPTMTGIYFTSMDTGYATGRQGTILKTTDQGQHWVEKSTGSSRSLFDLYFLNSDTGWAVGGSLSNSEVLYTSDGGDSWTNQTNKPFSGLYAVFFYNSDTGWAVGNNTVILRTTNGGTKWNSVLNSFSGKLNDVYFKDTDTGWAVGENGLIIHSTDGGKNWKDQSPNTSDDLEGIHFPAPDTGWAVGDRGKIYHTNDGGKTWQNQGGYISQSLSSIHFANTKEGWTVGEKFVFRTYDGGKTWRSTFTGIDHYLKSLHFIHHDTIWVVGNGGTIVKYENCDTYDTLNPVACCSYQSPNNHTWDTSGTYRSIITNQEGCDSLITINLTIIDPSFDTIQRVSCDSFQAPSNDQYWTSSGSFWDTLTNQRGCDSVIKVNLTINKSTRDTIRPDVCDHYTVPSKDETYSSSGWYKDTIPNNMGCDSFIAIDLNIRKSTDTSFSRNACDSFMLPSQGSFIKQSGQYWDTIPNAVGCDSILNIAVKVRPTTYDTLEVTICDSFTTPGQKRTLTSSGIYLDTLLNSVGCDSLITIDLTLNQTTYDTIRPSACQVYTVPSQDETYSSSGIYFDTLLNADGCDSILTIDLTIHQPSLNQIQLDACDSFRFPSGKKNVGSSGTYQDTLTNKWGCDSIIRMNVTILQNTFDTISREVCDEYTVPSKDETYAKSGSYMDTIQNHKGCDSIITIDLTIQHSTSHTIAPSACGFYEVPSGSRKLRSSGTYQDTIVNQAGCDSILTINLNLTKIDTGVTKSGRNLMAKDANGTYQWLICQESSLFKAMQGAQDRSFKVDSSGQYAVAITKNECSDTSNCHRLNSLSRQINLHHEWEVYPNPTDGNYHVQLDKAYETLSMTLQTVTGRILYRKKGFTKQSLKGEIKGPKGIYFLQIQTPTQKAYFKLIKR